MLTISLCCKLSLQQEHLHLTVRVGSSILLHNWVGDYFDWEQPDVSIMPVNTAVHSSCWKSLHSCATQRGLLKGLFNRLSEEKDDGENKLIFSFTTPFVSWILLHCRLHAALQRLLFCGTAPLWQQDIIHRRDSDAGCFILQQAFALFNASLWQMLLLLQWLPGQWTVYEELLCRHSALMHLLSLCSSASWTLIICTLLQEAHGIPASAVSGSSTTQAGKKAAMLVEPLWWPIRGNTPEQHTTGQ